MTTPGTNVPNGQMLASIGRCCEFGVSRNRSAMTRGLAISRALFTFTSGRRRSVSALFATWRRRLDRFNLTVHEKTLPAARQDPDAESRKDRVADVPGGLCRTQGANPRVGESFSGHDSLPPVGCRNGRKRVGFRPKPRFLEGKETLYQTLRAEDACNGVMFEHLADEGDDIPVGDNVCRIEIPESITI